MPLHYHLPSLFLYYRVDHSHPPRYPHSHQPFLPSLQSPYDFLVPTPYLEVRYPYSGYPYPMLPDIYIPRAYPSTFQFPYGTMRSNRGTEEHMIVDQFLILNDEDSDIFDDDDLDTFDDDSDIFGDDSDTFDDSDIETEQEHGLGGGEEMSFSSIGNLKRFVYDGTEKKYDEKECSICLEELLGCESSRDELGRMPCGHVFHYGCIVKWLSHSRACPLCRGTVD